MKKLIFKIFIVCCTAIAAYNGAQASHIAGASISYECIAPNEYKVKISIFRDCTGIPSELPTMLSATNACGTYISIALSPLPGTGAPLPAKCDNEPTTCDGGYQYGMMKQEAVGFFSIPPSTPDSCQAWTFSWSSCCRSANTTVPLGTDTYIQTIMYNRIATDPAFCNTSPKFNIPILPAFCINEPAVFDTQGQEPDGDSVAYSLVPVLQSEGISPNYTPGLTPTAPIFTTNGLNFDSLSGLISFVSNQAQLGLFAINAKEYRNGLIIGDVTLDIQLIVDIGDFCNIAAPTYTADSINITTCKANAISINLNRKVQCNSIDTDGSGFRLMDSLTQQNWSIASVGFICDSTLTTDSLYITLYDSLYNNGIYYLYSKQGNDGNTLLSTCPVAQAELDTLRIHVSGCANLRPARNNTIAAHTIINPNQAFELHIIANKPTELSIYNTLGQQIYYNNNYQNDFVGEGITAGIYYYTTKNENLYKKGVLNILK